MRSARQHQDGPGRSFRPEIVQDSAACPTNRVDGAHDSRICDQSERLLAQTAVFETDGKLQEFSTLALRES